MNTSRSSKLFDRAFKREIASGFFGLMLKNISDSQKNAHLEEGEWVRPLCAAMHQVKLLMLDVSPEAWWHVIVDVLSVDNDTMTPAVFFKAMRPYTFTGGPGDPELSKFFQWMVQNNAEIYENVCRSR